MWNNSPFNGYPPYSGIVYVPMPPTGKKSGGRKKKDAYDLVEEYKVTEQRLKDLKKLLKDEEKKDDKKKDKEGLGKLEIFILATIASPFIFMAEMWMAKYMIHNVLHMVQ